MSMARVVFRGKRLNTRTRDMILAAEKILGYTLTLIQGSYNAGGVSASAGTHDGGGAVDVWGKGTSHVPTEVAALRQVGFAAWGRTPSQGNWGYHIHCIAIGDQELSSGARNQVADYKAGRNGLASNGKDTFTRAYVNNTWEKYKAAHPNALPAYSGPANGVPIHSWSINYATKGKPMSGVTLADAFRFVAWARSQNIVSYANEVLYQQHCKKGEWAAASTMMSSIIKSVQRKAGVTADGKFGRETGAYLDNFGYKVYYNG